MGRGRCSRASGHVRSIRYHGSSYNARRVQQRFDVQDAALDWFTSYFADRTQVVVTGDDSSFVSELRTGAPQQSVLGPKSFVAYVEDFTEIFHNHRVRHHLFADDKQGTRHSKPSKVHEVTAGLGACITAMNDWCASKRLQLNTNKIEVMRFGSATNLSKLFVSFLQKS